MKKLNFNSMLYLLSGFCSLHLLSLTQFKFNETVPDLCEYRLELLSLNLVTTPTRMCFQSFYWSQKR